MRLNQLVVAGALAALSGVAFAQPAVFQDLGSLASPINIAPTHTFAAGEVKWYRMSLPAISDPSLYLDITTNGESYGDGDTEVGMYDSTGTLVATDDDGAGGFFSSLSFGLVVPVRPNGEGFDHDGRHGSLGAGVYYLAVTGYNATFNNGFSVTTTSGSTGPLTTYIELRSTPAADPPAPANDDCANAINITASLPVALPAVNVRSATVPTEAGMCGTGSHSIWYRFTPAATAAYVFSSCGDTAPACTILDTIISVYTSDGTCAALNPILPQGCNDDFCGRRSRVEVTLTAGQTYFIQLAQWTDNAPTTIPGLGSDMLQLHAAFAAAPPADRYVEAGDAGDLPTTASVAAGAGALNSIQGFLDGLDADMYLIEICDEASFSATTVGGAGIDTQLFLFTESGQGVAFNDDTSAAPVVRQSRVTTQFVNANGRYLLAVSEWDRDAEDANFAEIWNDTDYYTERAPDGAGAANPVAGWFGGDAGGPYIITLTGACFIAGSTCGSADFDGDGDTGTDADIEAFFACLGGNCCATCGSADFDGDGDTGTDADIEAFFRILGGGTC
jgi:hypothetical protein